MKRYLVTGGSGFIGSNFIQFLYSQRAKPIVVNIDKLTYAGNRENLSHLDGEKSYLMVQGDICDKRLVLDILREFKPDFVVNFAAESHVDRSIDGADPFIETNIGGTYALLQAAWSYYREQISLIQKEFRFLHVSTDEVFGSLGPRGTFKETSPYRPNSPYSASKAASDHLVRAWFSTYGLPAMVTNCSNNYGPFQYPEKLLPVVLWNALNDKPIPVYGDGSNVRDWIYVIDHCRALDLILHKGKPGESYNIGGKAEVTNLQMVVKVCKLLDELRPRADRTSYTEQISFVTDRPGHDFRYAINCSKLENELEWKREETIDSGLRKTITWYLANMEWFQNCLGRKQKIDRVGLSPLKKKTQRIVTVPDKDLVKLGLKMASKMGTSTESTPPDAPSKKETLASQTWEAPPTLEPKPEQPAGTASGSEKAALPEVTIYSDGGCRGNPGVGGYGVVLLYQSHKRELRQAYRKTTNNRMEMMAIMVGLQSLKEPCKVQVYTDSRYIVDAFQKKWAKGWRSRGWKKANGSFIANRDLWPIFWDLYQKHDVVFFWVKGHAGNHFNERCDTLCNMAMDEGPYLRDEPFEQGINDDVM